MAPVASSAPPRGRLRIRSNRNSLGVLLLLLAMAYAGASQSNAAAYLLAFLTLSLALVSVVHCWRNLRGLAVGAEPPPAVFAGEPLTLHLTLRRQGGGAARGLEIFATGAGAPWRLDELATGTVQRGQVAVATPQRGRFVSVPVEVMSTYPLGFVTGVWQMEVRQTYYVYPRPEGELPLPGQPSENPATPLGAFPEGDDFAGVRDWRVGESMRHIDWKAAARSDRLMVKQWSGSGAERLALDWDLLPQLETEARLRQLTRWVVQAARLDAAYQLRLPGRPLLPLGRGESHFHECLRALARFVEPRPSALATGGQTSAPPPSPRA